MQRNLGILDKDQYNFLWVTEFPLLEWSDEENRYVTMHHPFTMPMEEDIPLLDTDPGKIEPRHTDIVIKMVQSLGGGSVRIHRDDIPGEDVRDHRTFQGNSTGAIWLPVDCIQSMVYHLTQDLHLVLTVWLC